MKRFLLFLLIFVSLSLVGCSSDNASLEGKPIPTTPQKNETKAITVTDDFGYNVTVQSYPKRIVSLAPSNTEILFALGLGDRVVGVTDYCNYPPEVVEKRKRGEIESIGGYSTINVEKVVELKPDLVVACYGNGLGTIEALKRLGLTVICLNPKNLEDVMRDIEILGKVTGTEENATELIGFMRKRIERVERIVSMAEDKPKVVHIVWHDPIWISGKNTFIDDLITLAGGKNAFDKEGWATVSIEELVRANPDVIIVSSGNGMDSKGRDIIYEWVINEDRLKEIKAVKNGRVYVVDADIVSRPSYRLVYALEEFARFIHPELFEKEEISAGSASLSHSYACNCSDDWLCKHSSKACS